MATEVLTRQTTTGIRTPVTRGRLAQRLWATRVRYRPVLRQQSFLSEATYRHRSADGGHRWDLSRRTLLVVGGAFAV